MNIRGTELNIKHWISFLIKEVIEYELREAGSEPYGILISQRTI